MKTLIIVPAYNEQDNIQNVIDEFHALFPAGKVTREIFPSIDVSSDIADSHIDILIVNDCSTDNTEEILKQNGINYISAPVNLGIGGTVQTGYRYADRYNYDVAIQIDGDGQHDMKFIPELLCQLATNPLSPEGADLVIGSRFITKEGFQSSGTRRIGISLLSFFIYLCTMKKIKDVTSGFRAINRKLIKIYADDYPEDYPEPEAIVAAVMHLCKVSEVPVIMRERNGGVSSINLKKSVYYMIKVSLAIFITRISFGIRRSKTKC